MTISRPTALAVGLPHISLPQSGRLVLGQT